MKSSFLFPLILPLSILPSYSLPSHPCSFSSYQYHLSVLCFTHSITPQSTSTSVPLITNLLHVSSLLSASHLDTQQATHMWLISATHIHDCWATFPAHVSDADVTGISSIVSLLFCHLLCTQCRSLTILNNLVTPPYFHFHALELLPLLSFSP